MSENIFFILFFLPPKSLLSSLSSVLFLFFLKGQREGKKRGEKIGLCGSIEAHLDHLDTLILTRMSR